MTVSTNDNGFGESQGIDAVLVNTNQFYKWFTDLESAMKSEVSCGCDYFVAVEFIMSLFLICILVVFYCNLDGGEVSALC